MTVPDFAKDIELLVNFASAKNMVTNYCDYGRMK